MPTRLFRQRAKGKSEVRDWTHEDMEAYDDFMDSWANAHLCDTQDETLGSEKVELKFIELKVANPFP